MLGESVRILVFIAVLVVVQLVCSRSAIAALQPGPAARQPDPAARQPDPVENEVLELEHSIARALADRDRAALDALLASEFVLRGRPNLTRETWLSNAVTFCWGRTYELSDFMSRRDGGTMIVTFVLTFSQDPLTCQRATLRSLVTDVWVRESDRWQLLIRHASGTGLPTDPSGVRAQFTTVPGPPPVWQIDAELSFVSTSGNTDTQTVGTTSELRHQKGSWNTTARGVLVRSTASGVESARSTFLELRPGHRVSPRLTVFGRVGFRRDRFAGITARLNFNTGLAYHILQDRRRDLQAEVALGYDRERRVASPEVQFAAAQTRLTYVQRFSPTLSFTDEGAVVAAVDDVDNWRGSNKASIIVGMSRSLSLKLSHQLEFVNQPVPGFGRLDTITSAGLVVTLRR
jgi:putative salt-induced outer membrane protein